jgi:hypothetical protein
LHAGERFLQSFPDAVNKRTENSSLFQSIDDDIRRVRLKDLPYSVLCFIQENRVIVVACAHAKRRPGYWRLRLESR